jgi:hypothetical protein
MPYLFLGQTALFTIPLYSKAIINEENSNLAQCLLFRIKIRLKEN